MSLIDRSDCIVENQLMELLSLSVWLSIILLQLLLTVITYRYAIQHLVHALVIITSMPLRKIAAISPC